MEKKKKILVYNWAPAFDPERRGGGVSAYQNNLIIELMRHDFEVVSFSSGIAYDLFSTKPYMRRTSLYSKSAHEHYELVNSPVLAPAHDSFGYDNVSTGASAIAETLSSFIRRKGGFDVIHFNNLEGLPAQALQILKNDFPLIKFVFYIHNYYPFCPQVNLWKNESVNCVNYDEGRACTSCVTAVADPGHILKLHQRAFFLRRLGITPNTFIWKRSWRLYERLRIPKYINSVRKRRSVKFNFEPIKFKANSGKLNDNYMYPSHAKFAERRHDFVSLINDTFDVVLCASRRVKYISAHYGLSSQKLETCYIGSKFSSQLPSSTRREGHNGELTIGFLGYARKDKGFFFFLNCLKTMDNETAKRINVKLIAQGVYPSLRQYIRSFSGNFKSFEIVNGYNHENLKGLLENVDLGVVPVLWEDCLPQVAIELVCNGIPILTSNRGGAKEIANHPAFTFISGSTLDFNYKLTKLLSEKSSLRNFWDNGVTIFSNTAHVEKLIPIYFSGDVEISDLKSNQILEQLADRNCESNNALHLSTPSIV